MKSELACLLSCFNRTLLLSSRPPSFPAPPRSIPLHRPTMPLSKTDMIISDTVTGAASILFAGLRVATHLSQPGHKRRSEQIGMLSLVFAAMLVIPQVVLSRVDDWKTEEWYKVPRGEDELPYQLTSEPQQVGRGVTIAFSPAMWYSSSSANSWLNRCTDRTTILPTSSRSSPFGCSRDPTLPPSGV